MRRKSGIAALLSVVLLCVQTTGCIGEKTGVAVREKRKEVLTLMAVGTGYEQAFTDVIEAAAERFNEDNPYNVEIRAEWYENEQYKEKLAMLMTQNEVTDIFFTWEAGFLENYVKSGKVAPVSEVLKKDPEWSSRFEEGAFDAVTFDGEIYALPMGQAVIPVYYNKELFEKNKVQIPQTWEELLKAITAFQNAGVTPIAMGFREPWISGQMMLELSGGVGGIRLYEDTVNGMTGWEDGRWVETGKAFQELADCGAFEEDFLKVTNDEARRIFTEGRAAMYPMGTWDTAAVISGFGGADQLGAFLMPAKNARYQDTRIKTFEKLFAVSERCENQEGAFAFLKTLTDEITQEEYMIKCGALPVTKVPTDSVDSLTREILELQGKVTNALTPMDRKLGEELGGEFNKVSLAVAGGADAKEQFLKLQAYAKREKEK